VRGAHAQNVLPKSILDEAVKAMQGGAQHFAAWDAAAAHVVEVRDATLVDSSIDPRKPMDWLLERIALVCSLARALGASRSRRRRGRRRDARRGGRRRRRALTRRARARDRATASVTRCLRSPRHSTACTKRWTHSARCFAADAACLTAARTAVVSSSPRSKPSQVRPRLAALHGRLSVRPAHLPAVDDD